MLFDVIRGLIVIIPAMFGLYLLLAPGEKLVNVAKRRAFGLRLPSPPAGTPAFKVLVGICRLVGIAALGVSAYLIFVPDDPFTVWYRKRSSSLSSTQRVIEQLAKGIDLHKSDSGSLPLSLDALPQSDIYGYCGKGACFPRCFLWDGWGNRMQYVNKTNEYELRSAGRDGKFQTKDDIVLKR